MGNGGQMISKHPRNPIQDQIVHLQRVWNNKHYYDFGIERLIRLTLALSLFLFPGIYIKSLFNRFGIVARKLSIDFYVLFKFFLPLIFFYFHLTKYTFTVFMAVYMGLETMVYLASLIYLSNEYPQPISYRRSLTALFINYIEICFDYGVIYSYCNHNLPHFFKEKLISGMQLVYFSFATSATVGYGDITPVHKLGQMLVITQIIIFMIFVGLFINFFASRIHNTKYHNNERDFL